MLIGLIADTHVPYRRQNIPRAVFDAFRDVDLILHAGDINVPEVLVLLSIIAPVEAIAGNGDDGELAATLGYSKLLQLGGFAVGLTHGHLGSAKNTPQRALTSIPEADIIVFGHSHVPLIEQRGMTLLVNPGSPTDKRRQPYFSVGLLSLDTTARAEIVRF